MSYSSKMYTSMLRDQARRFNLLHESHSKYNSANYNRTIYSTWQISFQMIQGHATRGFLASELLQLFSQLHYAQMSQEIFRRTSDHIGRLTDSGSDTRWLSDRISPAILHMLKDRHGNRWNSGSFEGAIHLLQCCSFIRFEKDGLEGPLVLSMHPLVHSWTANNHHSQRSYKSNPEILLPASSLSIYIYRTDYTFDSESDVRHRREVFIHIESFRKLGYLATLYDCIQIPTFQTKLTCLLGYMRTLVNPNLRKIYTGKFSRQERIFAVPKMFVPYNR